MVQSWARWTDKHQVFQQVQWDEQIGIQHEQTAQMSLIPIEIHEVNIEIVLKK